MAEDAVKRKRLFARKPHQIIRRITLRDVMAVRNDAAVAELLSRERETLGEGGNIVIRFAGIPTENYILAEGTNKTRCTESLERVVRFLIRNDYMDHEHDWEVLRETDYGEMDYSSYSGGTEHFVVTLYRCSLCGALRKESRGDFCGDPEEYLTITDEEYACAARLDAEQGISVSGKDQ